MKKTIALSLFTLCTTMGMNAQESVVYDFNNTPDFFPILQKPIEEEGMGISGNYDIIKNTGAVGVPYGAGAGSETTLCVKDEATGKWQVNPDLRVRISLADGISYGLTADGKYKYETYELDYSYPFIGYGEKGPTRVLWMPKKNDLETWVDAPYNAATAEDWVSTQHFLQFARNGNSASRTDTWVQFPEFQGPFTVTYYVSSNPDTKRNKEQGLKCKVVPVKGEEELTDLAQVIDEAYGTVKEKQYYKKIYTYTGTDKVAIRIGANGNQLDLYHVVFTPGADQTGIEDVIVDEANENAPVYNLMGIQVDETYKGIVIKNGKKYVQR